MTMDNELDKELEHLAKLVRPAGSVVDQVMQRIAEETVSMDLQPSVRPVPDVPTEQADGVQGGLHPIEQPPRRRHTRWRFVTMFQKRSVRWSMAAAAIVIAFVGVGSWQKLGKGKSGVVFAQVLKNIQSVRSVRFKGTGTIQIPGLAEQTMTMETIIVEPGRMRQSIATSYAGMPDPMVHICDYGQGRWLTLYPQLKRAFVMQTTDMPSNLKAGNLLDRFRQLHEKVGIPIGEQEIAGRSTQGFKVGVPPTDMEMLIWVDTKTQLPILIELTSKGIGAAPSSTMTWSDFVWDAEVDESLMSLTPPEDYEVIQADESNTVSCTTHLNPGTATEQDVIEGLETVVELNGGKFPATLDFKSLEGLFKQLESSQNDPTQNKEAKAREMQLRTTIGLAWKFINEPESGDDFHYAGKDVQYGQAGIPVFWYQPKDSATYRVIDADLTVRDVLPADVPSVPSTLLRPKTPAAVTQPPKR